MCCTVLASLIFLCTSRIVQWGALRTSCDPYVSSGIRGKKEKRERQRESSCFSQPSLCAVILPPSFLFSLRKGSTTPCQPIRTQLHPLHHIISVSKVTGRPLSLSLSLPLCFQTERCRIIIIIPPIRPFTPPSHTELVASLALASPVLASSLSLSRSLSFCSGIATTSTAPPFSSLCIL